MTAQSPFANRAHRRDHLADDNLLRAFTLVIDEVPGGINLGQGVCDLEMPGPLQKGAIAAIDGGDRQIYTHYSGLDGLKGAIVDKLARHNGLHVGMDEVMVTTGSSGAFFIACMVLLEPGDEVILFEPYYGYHRSTLLLAEAVPVVVPLERGTFELDIERLRAAITPRTRAVMINTPVNPSGKVFTRSELETVAAVLDGTDVVVFTDEVYEYMCFDGREHISPATIPGLADRTVTMNSFSKTFSITGWRIGFLSGPADVVADCGRVFDQVVICAPRPLQRGVERALRELPDSFYTDLRDGYQEKRDVMCAALDRAGFTFVEPEGTYYVLADYREVLGDISSADAVRTMIDRIGVNAVPGGVFYDDPVRSREIRFHFAVEDDVLEDVAERVQRL
jgi:aminotransferase